MLSKTDKRNFIFTGVLGLVFIIFTILVMTVDVREIGPKFSSVGFADLNSAFYHTFSYSAGWYGLSKWLGYLVFLLVFYFAAMGLLQLIKRKSFKKVDISIYVLGGFYILVGLLYLFFNVFVVNYRPVILEEELEPSYPSSHTMLAICVVATALMQFKDREKNKKTYNLMLGIGIIIMILLILSRLLSGVHWFTDIVASVLLSATLVMLYYSVITLFKDKKLYKGE